MNEELRQKRCRDLDYWVFKVEGKMSDLSKNLNLFNTIFLFQKDVPLIFNKIKDPECVRNKDTLNNLEVRKKLDDYCENRDYINEKMKIENNKHFCLKYFKYISENEDFFFNNEESRCKHQHFKRTHCIIHDKCTIEDRSATFPKIECDIYDTSYVSENNYLLKKLLLATPIILGIFPLFLYLYKVNLVVHIYIYI